MSDRAGAAALNSIIHGASAAFAGALVDSFFAANPDEDLMTTLALFTMQNVVAGLAMSTLSQLPAAMNSNREDPTGGALVLGPFFLAMPQYRMRLVLLATSVRAKLQDALRLPDAKPDPTVRA